MADDNTPTMVVRASRPDDTPDPPPHEPISLGGLAKFGMLPNMLYDFAANFSPTGIYNALSGQVQRSAEHVDRAMRSPALTLDPEAMHGLTEEAVNYGMLGSSIPLRPAGSLGMFGGVGARTADHTALGTAMGLENASFPPSAILERTGWFRGADGVWKNEISDHEARLTWPSHAIDPNGNLMAPHHNGLWPSDPAALSLSGIQRLAATMQSMRNRTVGDILHHPDFFAAYPEFANVKVAGVHPDLVALGQSGGFDPATNTLKIASNTPDEILKTILHEGQHWIQEREGFAPGGSHQGFLPIDFYEQQENIENLIEPHFHFLEGHNLKPHEVFNALFAANDGVATPAEIAMVQHVGSMMGSQKTLEYFNLGQKYAYLRKLESEAAQNYHHIAGEVESRAVEDRMKMTPQERRLQHVIRTVDPNTGAANYIPYHQQIVMPAGSQMMWQPALGWPIP